MARTVDTEIVCSTTVKAKEKTMRRVGIALLLAAVVASLTGCMGMCHLI